MTTRPRLTPAMADVRRAVRDALALVYPDAGDGVHRDPSSAAHGGWMVPTDAPLVLVALSGGPDSLALAVALGFEQGKCGVRAGAVIVDHGLQEGSGAVAERAAEQARAAGLDPIVVRRVAVTDEGGGPEADARAARYSAFGEVARETGATAVLIGHTLDDQAETVLLGLARGSGARSLAGMRLVSHRSFAPDVNADAAEQELAIVRPLLGLRRLIVSQSLTDQGIEPWFDPHNADPSFARVRVRANVLPVLEAELGPGVAEALARTAGQSADDADVLEELAADVLDRARNGSGKLSTLILEQAQPALASRAVRTWLSEEIPGREFSQSHVLSILELVTEWRGQAGIDVPGGRVTREADGLRLSTHS
ncbi:MAG: tRNA lysidine(34) synthetase TilS [Actinobacteria bacterium]|uniref:tRNA(Ile)-lysidine synthetase n=1 Tax=freshwater metagenome TaxID=449393 RepID=A0A6J7GKM7_9ZZZZ|nr:tRNA lysidine(34) synthetase TilS [Actinomycetota bacterium]